jgi:hypothetical protein
MAAGRRCSRTFGTPMVGQFQNGRGEFSDREFFHGKLIDLHCVFSNVTDRSFSWRTVLSSDSGKKLGNELDRKFHESGALSQSRYC